MHSWMPASWNSRDRERSPASVIVRSTRSSSPTQRQQHEGQALANSCHLRSLGGESKYIDEAKTYRTLAGLATLARGEWKTHPLTDHKEGMGWLDWLE